MNLGSGCLSEVSPRETGSLRVDWKTFLGLIRPCTAAEPYNLMGRQGKAGRNTGKRASAARNQGVAKLRDD